MSWGQDFLKGFFGTNGLRDYTHASNAFRTNGYELSPRYKFLFHVYFTLNTTAIPQLQKIFDPEEIARLSLVVKNIKLPGYEIDNDVLNQYNRKRIVQTKVNYNPVDIVFHDDGGDLVRSLWYNYFSYYYKDPSQQYGNASNQNGQIGIQTNRTAGFDYNARDTYANDRFVNDWGYIGESYSDSAQGKPPFFKDIRIYGFDQHKFAEYILINPTIINWDHDTYDYAEGDGLMTHTVKIRYETVKYSSGALGGVRSDTNVKGFGSPTYYDNVRSPIARAGSTASVLGQGGLLDTGIGIYRDLQSGSLAGAIGAVQKAGATYYTFKGKNLQAVINQEASTAATTVLRNTRPGAVRGLGIGDLFPTPPRQLGTGTQFGILTSGGGIGGGYGQNGGGG